MGSFRERVVQDDWRERGFDLSALEVREVDRFFDCWFEAYNRPGVGAYRSREALMAIHVGLVRAFGDQLGEKERSNAASVLRAGYVVAATEQSLGFRPRPDRNLVELFRLMEEDDPSPEREPLAIAHWRGTHLATVAARIAGDEVMASNLPGFAHREAVFADLRRTLFTKLRLTSILRASFDLETAETAMRYGHVVGVCEESVPATLPVDERV